jgi:hypothetical protein
MRIRREDAIERINLVRSLVTGRNYRELDIVSSEDGIRKHEDLVQEAFDDLNTRRAWEVPVERWSNDMLEEQMDKPLYRHSYFDNYHVLEDK